MGNLPSDPNDQKDPLTASSLPARVTKAMRYQPQQPGTFTWDEGAQPRTIPAMSLKKTVGPHWLSDIEPPSCVTRKVAEICSRVVQPYVRD